MLVSYSYDAFERLCQKRGRFALQTLEALQKGIEQPHQSACGKGLPLYYC